MQQDKQGQQKGIAASSLVAIVAMTSQGVIGNEGDMPWRLSSDLQRFKRQTMGGVLIMGRRTYDSIGRPLPGRRTIVISRNPRWHADGVEIVDSPEKAVALASHAASSSGCGGFVVGGAEIYRQLIPQCDQIWLTRVWSSVSGDTLLSIDLSEFRQMEQTRVPASIKNSAPTEFVRLLRKKS